MYYCCRARGWYRLLGTRYGTWYVAAVTATSIPGTRYMFSCFRQHCHSPLTAHCFCKSHEGWKGTICRPAAAMSHFQVLFCTAATADSRQRTPGRSQRTPAVLGVYFAVCTSGRAYCWPKSLSDSHTLTTYQLPWYLVPGTQH